MNMSSARLQSLLVGHYESPEGWQVFLEIEKQPISPAKLIDSTEEIRLRANALFPAEQSKDLRGVIAKKIEALRHYDVLAMDRVVAILSWGRSGSLLLASYLDGHEDVISLPELCSWKLYEFFDRYQSLPLGDKLLAYPAYEPGYTRFFEGAFAISSVQYYAAVQAILEFYRTWPSDFRESRRAFFLFVHIAYDLALGRSPATPHPLIVYAQHLPDTVTATHLVEDFPETKFVHAIRDPITTCDRTFHYFLDALVDRHNVLPYSVLDSLTGDDRPQSGMESRTRAIRLEDLHSDTAETMLHLSDWLGLSYRATLIESTFNGIPYLVTSDGTTWSGRRLEQARRRSQYISRKDRALLFALFYQNFVEWQYACPKIFAQRLVRCLVFVSLFLFPMKTEIVGARAIFKRRVLPSVRRGNILAAIKPILGIGLCRLKIVCLLVPEFFRRCARVTTVLQVDSKSRRRQRPDVDMRAARSEAKVQ
jgi:hypothetical protein